MRRPADWVKPAFATCSSDETVSGSEFGSDDPRKSESPSPNLSWTASVAGLGFLGDDAVGRLRVARGLSSDLESESDPDEFPGPGSAFGVLRISSGTSVGRLDVFGLTGAIAGVGSMGASVFGVFFERGARFGVPS